MDDRSKTTVWVIVLIIIVLILAGLVIARRRKSVYTGGADDRSRQIMLPAGKGPHTHLVDLDVSGFGISTEDMGHRHVVENSVDVGVEDDGRTVPADHVHSLGEFIVDVQEE